jgi:predicted ATPase/class 3 adenylate cyclase
MKLVNVCPSWSQLDRRRRPRQACDSSGLPLIAMLDQTFLFTDIEGSTTLWERFPERMRGALERHDSILRTIIEGHNGCVFKTIGDSFCAVFSSPHDAIAAAAAAQHNIAAQAWEEIGEPIRVRMAIHSGPAEARDGDYFGPTLNRTARILASAHGGQIVLSKAVADPLADRLPDSAKLIDLGEHRLRDLVRPEHIFQYSENGLRDDFPLLRSLSAFAHNLPEQLTSFVGRETELAEIKHLLSRTRLLTLSGSGGNGKTRLALQAAAEMVDQFTNGVWFVDMATVLDPTLIATMVATTLRLREQSGQAILETLVAFLRDKRLLLILDNCEQIVSACAELAEKLLKTCPDLRILATSREGLGIVGETTWRVPSLPTPSNQDLNSFEKIAESPSVRLFVDRAASVVRDFRLTPKNAPAIAKVCQRLDGIPLAVELAAARVKTISPEEIVLRLNDRFRLLTGGSRTALPRHQTLRAAIDWSYHLLGGLEGVLFRRLSLFCGGFSLDAAESICAGPDLESMDVFDSVCRLVDKSLLILEQSEGTARYRMLETIREYAFDRLRESGEVSDVQTRFLDFFLNLGRRAEQELLGAAQGEWLERLDAEQENFRAALTWNVEQSELRTAQLNLALTLWRYWLIRGYWEEGLTCLLRVISPDSVRRFASERSRALNSCGNLACQLGRYSEATRHYEQSLSIRRELGDERGIAATLNNLGNVYLLQRDHDRAGPLFLEGLALFRKLGNERGLAACLINVASVRNAKGDYLEAGKNAAEALEIFRKVGDNIGIGGALRELGKVAMSLREMNSARSYFEESLALFTALGEKVGIVGSLQGLGQLMMAQNNYESARVLYQESLDIARDLGAVPYVVAANAGLESLNHAESSLELEVEI